MSNKEHVEEIDDSVIASLLGEATAGNDISEEEKLDPAKNINNTEDDFEISFSGEEEEEEDDLGNKGKQEEEEEEDDNPPTPKPENKKESGKQDNEEEEQEEAVDALGVIDELIKDEIIFAFEDGEGIETAEDLKELIKANIEQAKQAPREEIEEAFYASLPEEVKLLSEYAKQGASPQEIKQMFRVLAEKEEVEQFDPSSTNGQKEIVREYLRMTKFGTEEEIAQEIEDWEDVDKLEEKAKRFLPKLEKAKEKEAQAMLIAKQEQAKSRAKAREEYNEKVNTTLSEKKLLNVSLHKSKRDMLIKELTENAHLSEINGRPLNGLGKALEEIAILKPNIKLLAELTYFATDPEGFMKTLKETIREEEVGKTVRKLKTSGSSTKVGSGKKKLNYRGINNLS